jgi:hypothetical protein
MKKSIGKANLGLAKFQSSEISELSTIIGGLLAVDDSSTGSYTTKSSATDGDGNATDSDIPG